MNRQNAADVRVGGGGRRRDGGRLPLVVVVQTAEGTSTLAMAKGRRVERLGGVSDQIAWARSNEQHGVCATGIEIWMDEGPNFDGH